jgi:serine/threonine protein kinase
MDDSGSNASLEASSDDQFAHWLEFLDAEIRAGKSVADVLRSCQIPEAIKPRLENAAHGLRWLEAAQPRTANKLTHLSRATQSSTAAFDGIADSDLSTAQQLPARIGPYEILKEIGRAGMGVVYLARQPGLSSHVAVKVIRHGDLSTPEERARFRREVAAVARLHHPNVVQVHLAGDHEGLPYFSMEYIEGGDLARLLSHQPQPSLVAAKIVETLAWAVQHCHDHHVVHRDLKPSNVLVQIPDKSIRDNLASLPVHRILLSSVLKIADFGLAKSSDPNSTQSQHRTVAGTYNYMAPEQADRDRATQILPASDIYSLGAILYETLTGQPPLELNDTRDALQQIMNDEVPALRTRVKTIAPDLEAICLKCLRKDPNERYASAAALADDLARWQAEGRTHPGQAGTASETFHPRLQASSGRVDRGDRLLCKSCAAERFDHLAPSARTRQSPGGHAERSGTG